MHPFKTATYILSCILLTSVHTGAQAAVTLEQWQQLNQNIVNGHILPAYENLALQSEQLELQTKALCTVPESTQLLKTRNQYIQTLAAWQSIQHVTFGPIELLMRSYSIQFWPDKKNLTSKQLNKMLAAEDPASLSDEAFMTASIAVKGLPAMERLLFSDSALEQLKQQPFRCEFLHAVSDYVKAQTTNTHKEWLAFKQEYSYLESEEGLYENSEDAAIDLMKAQVEPLEIIKDLKILRPLGKNKAKAKRLESWRSKHSLENIAINIRTLHHMYSGVDGTNLHSLLKDQGGVDLAEGIEVQFNALETILDQIPSPLSEHIYDDTVREQLLLLVQGLNLLHSHLEKSMGLLELQLGFNSRDGD